MDEILVLSTAGTLSLAQEIASALIEAREAACVNIVPGIRSIYRWGGKVCNEGEFLILIKSTSDKFESVRARVRLMHTYQVPEVIALPVTNGDADYLAWIRSSLQEAG